MNMAVDTLQDIFCRLHIEGVSTNILEGWPNMGLLAILLRTEPGTCYIIEPVIDEPSLVTRLSEVTPYYGEYRIPSGETLVRRQGNPDRTIKLGKEVNILGLPRRGTVFDPDSIYTTTQLVEIKYLDSSDHKL